MDQKEKNRNILHTILLIILFIVILIGSYIMIQMVQKYKTQSPQLNGSSNIEEPSETLDDTNPSTDTNQTTPPESTELAEYPVYYANTEAEIFASPNPEGEIIGKLYLHEPVRVMEEVENNAWGKIRMNGGEYGYVPMYQLSQEILKEVDESQTYWEYSRTGLEIQINKYAEDNLVYWVADVYTENPEKDLNTAWAGGSYEASYNQRNKTSQLAYDNNAIFAVNGDSAGARKSGSEFENPIIIRNGILYHEDERDIGEMCALNKDGELVIFRPGELGSAQEMIDAGVTDTWWFDCTLLKNGEIPNSLIEVEGSLEKAPYTAIGQKDKNHFLFIVVDGRGSNGSEGVTYTGMARLMQRYGAVTAYELDGGGSSTIYFDGMVLNKPSDGSQRAISDIIYVAR